MRLLAGLAGLAALAAAVPAVAAQVRPASVEGLARASDAVVRGRVAGARVERTADGLRLSTAVEVRVTEVYRGRAPAVATVRVPGGADRRIVQRVDGAPTLAPGEEVVLFLRRAGPDGYAVTGLAQGKYAVAGGVARPDLSRLDFVPGELPPGERRAGEMDLAELARRARGAR